MRFSLGRLATLAAVLLPFAFALPADLKIRNAAATDVVPDSYIIVYKNDVAGPSIMAHENSISSMISKRGASYTGIGAKYSMDGFKGYQIHADSATIQAIAASPEVYH